jgi:soluble lytic murein transglycosylase-like protein
LSWAGAKGIAQIMPDTASGWGVDPWNPVTSLKAAADHMAWYYRNYGYDYGKALACYNAGCNAVVWAQSHCLNYYWCLPSETRHYIDVIEG